MLTPRKRHMLQKSKRRFSPSILSLIATMSFVLCTSPSTAQNTITAWTNHYDGSGNYIDEGRALVVDSSGNVIVAGDSYNNFTFYPDYAIIKYSGAGVALWTNRYKGPGNANSLVKGLAVDSSGSVVVT